LYSLQLDSVLGFLRGSFRSTDFGAVRRGDIKKGKGSPYSITERRVPKLIPVLGSQPAGDVSHKPGGRLPLLSARPAVTPATLKRASTNFFCCLVNRGTMGVNSLPKTVTRQRRDCDLNPGPSAPESSTLTTRLPSHPQKVILHRNKYQLSLTDPRDCIVLQTELDDQSL